MCLILFAYEAHSKYKLILAANRDEFYDRPTAPAAFWKDAPRVLAGRDLVAGGTWLGVTQTGRFAAVTNFRDPFAPKGERSRGALVSDFLIGADSSPAYLKKIEANKTEYSGFNLLFGKFKGNQSVLFYVSNRSGDFRVLENGIYGLSNHLLDTDWQKVSRGKIALERLLTGSEIQPTDLLGILQDQTIADDAYLPETGIGIERERLLSPAFIQTPIYGTRCSTALLIERSGKINFVEKRYAGEFEGDVVNGTSQFEFEID